MIDVIRTGYAKSASTFLQNAFTRHPSIEMLESRPIERPLVFADDNVFDTALRRRPSPDGQWPDMVYLLSDEGLCGWGCFFNYARIARRLARTFGDARILIVVREQAGFLESLYRHELLFGYGFSPERFIRSYCAHRNVFRGLTYDVMLAEYRDLFENFHVELMERSVGPRARAIPLVPPLGPPCAACQGV